MVDFAVAKTAYATAKSMGASDKIILALMEAGLVESGMRNLNYGDRDSLGFLQQRASWGSRETRLNVAESTQRFVNKAKRLESKYATAGALAQGVQVSAYPSRYSAREAEARNLIERLGGSSLENVSLVKTVDAGATSIVSEELGRRLLTALAGVVLIVAGSVGTIKKATDAISDVIGQIENVSGNSG